MDVPDAGAHRAWMRRRHDAMRTPRAIIDARVRVATGTRPQALRRLVVGEDNEVYEVTTAGGDRLIVRISHVEDPRFADALLDDGVWPARAIGQVGELLWAPL